MHRRRTLIIATALTLAAALTPTVAFADTTLPDSYFTSHIAPLTSDYQWSPLGSYNPVRNTCGTLGISGTSCKYVSQDTYQHTGTTHNTDNSTLAYVASSAWFGYVNRGAPATTVAGPFNTSDALSLNGGGLNAVDDNGSPSGDWEWCGYFDVHDQTGAVLFSTQEFNSDGTVSNHALYVSVGTADNLVVAIRNTSLTADPGVADNDYTATSQNTWEWMCVGYYASTHQVVAHWPTGGTATFAAPSPYIGFTSSDGGGFHYVAEGNIDLYGYLIEHGSATSASGTFQEPSCGLTSTCGTGGSGGGVAGCAQQGPISGQPKLQWCPPDLGCNNFDTGWDIGADFAWLGCQVEQLGLTIVSGIVNIAIDLVVPDFGAIQAQWDTTATDLQTHVPLNYVYGALTAIPNAFSGAHSVPTLTFHLPPPWSFDVHITWANIIGGAAPYRTLMAGLLYFAFAAAVTINARRAFES